MRAGGYETSRAHALLIASACAVVLLLAAQLPFPLNHDAAWHFSTGFRVLEGAEVGRDVVDINPPMSAWLFSLPALAAKLTGAPPSLVFKTFTLLICGASLILSGSLLRRMGYAGRPLAIVIIVLAAALLVVPGYDFAQREHLMAALTVPYVLLAAARGRQAKPLAALLIGVAAGVAIGIKPYFVMLPLYVELWLLWHTRNPRFLLRPELVAMALTGALYLAAVVLFASHYLTDVLPNALSNYGGYDVDSLTLAARIAGQVGAPLIACLICFAKDKAFARSKPAQVLFAVALGMILAALLQGKGWAYHLLPAKIYLVSVIAVFLAGTERFFSWSKPLLGATIVIAAASLFRPVFLNLVDGYSATGTSARVERLTKLFEDAGDAKASVFAFITSPREIHPAVLQSGARWANAAGAMIYLPAMAHALQDQNPSAETDAIIAVAERHDLQVIDDLERFQPAVIAVDSGRRKLGLEELDFDYLTFFDRYPEFRAVWRHYEEREPIGRFRIFVRHKQAAGRP